MAKQSTKVYRTVKVLYVCMSSELAEWPPHAATEWESGGSSQSRYGHFGEKKNVLCLPRKERQTRLTSDPWLSHYTDREERSVC